MSLSSSLASWETPGRLEVVRMRRRHGSTPNKGEYIMAWVLWSCYIHEHGFISFIPMQEGGNDLWHL